MSHSYVSNRMHCVFSTKDRRKLIDQDLESRLWPYIVGTARQNGFQIAPVGGVEDHIHLLVLLPGPLSVSKAIFSDAQGLAVLPDAGTIHFAIVSCENGL